MSHLVDRGRWDDWVQLENVARGELRLATSWREAVPVDDEDADDFESFILSVYVDSCKNVGQNGGKRPPSPKCVLTHTQGDAKSTRIAPKTRDPVFEEAFIFSGSKSLDTDSLTIEVIFFSELPY